MKKRTCNLDNNTCYSNYSRDVADNNIWVELDGIRFQESQKKKTLIRVTM